MWRNYLLEGSFVCPDTFNKRDGKWVELVCLVRLVHYRERHAKAEVLQVPHLHIKQPYKYSQHK
jgi:hypothetical protein